VHDPARSPEAGKLYFDAKWPSDKYPLLDQDGKGFSVAFLPGRLSDHNLRHSLASFLVRTKTDPKTVQTLLRHSNVKTTLQLYAHSCVRRSDGGSRAGAGGFLATAGEHSSQLIMGGGWVENTT